MSDTDQILLNRWITNRDAQAFKRLTTKHCGMVYATCLRILRNASDAEEAAQESFAAMATATRGPDGAMGAWLHRIATNQALNRRRADTRRRERESRYAQLRAGTTTIEWDDVSQFVDQCIESLSEPVRSNIIAHFFEDETLTAIAAREGVTHSAVSQRIRKGIEMIRDRMQRNGIPIAAAALGAMFSKNLVQATPVPASLRSALGKRALTGSTARISTTTRSPVIAKMAIAAGAVISAAIGLLAAIYVTQPQTVTAGQHTEHLRTNWFPDTTDMEAIHDRVTAESVKSALAALTPVPTAVNDAEQVEPLSWRGVVNAYAAHQDRIRRIQFDYEDISEGEYLWSSYSAEPGYRKLFQRGNLLTDGERCVFKQYRWGDWYGAGPVPSDRPHVVSAVDDGYTYMQLGYVGEQGNAEPGFLQIHPDARNSDIRKSAYRDGRTHVLFSRYPGRLIIGLPLDQGLRLEEILYGAHSIALRDEREDVNGAMCHVIDADTAYGDFSVWFDPERDYNVARCIVDTGYGDVNDSLPIDDPNSWDRYEYTAVRFVRIDGHWITKESESRHIVERRQRNGFDFTSRHKRSNIRLLAPGEDDGAYVIRGAEIPDGTRLMDPIGTVRQSGDPRWQWYDDQFVLTYDNPDGTVRRDSSTARGFGGGILRGVLEPR